MHIFCIINFSVPRIPEQPVDLQYTILINRNNLTARLTWKAPYSDTPIEGYRVVYGHALLREGTTEASLDKTMSMTKVLSPVSVSATKRFFSNQILH